MPCETRTLCTIKEATSILKKARDKHFHVCVNVNLPVVDDEGNQENTYFPGYNTIRVSRKDAIKFVRDTLKGFEARGARILIAEWDSIIFIG